MRLSSIEVSQRSAKLATWPVQLLRKRRPHVKPSMVSPTRLKQLGSAALPTDGCLLKTNATARSTQNPPVETSPAYCSSTSKLTTTHSGLLSLYFHYVFGLLVFNSFVFLNFEL